MSIQLYFLWSIMVFTKILKPSVEMLRSLGIQPVIFMDIDMLQAEAIGSCPDVTVSPREPGVHYQHQ